MPETEIEPTTDPAGAPSERDTGAKGQQGQGQDQDAADWRQRARQHEDRAKALVDKAKKWDDYEAKSQTESEKTAKRIADAEKRASDAESRALRLEIATAKGLTPAQAKRLVGATREELEADADELLSSFKASETATPKPDFGGGQRGTDVSAGANQITDRDELKKMTPAEIVKAKEDGRLDQMLGLNK